MVVGRIPLASRKARSDCSQRRKVSALTPAARESSDLVYDFMLKRKMLLGTNKVHINYFLLPKELRRNSAGNLQEIVRVVDEIRTPSEGESKR